jgi:predicted negative regulator of RcsB-dependent stress response
MANTTQNKPGTQPSAGLMEDNHALENVQSFYEQRKKQINTIIIVAVVAIAGFFIYQRMYKAPRETKAANALFAAQTYFGMDSLNKALNGDGQHLGFTRIIRNYGGTRAANLAHYYAGISYLKSGDFKKAIEHLEDFDGKGTQFEYLAKGAIGDAYMESGNAAKAIDAYQKAAANRDDKMITPVFLLRLGMAQEQNNKPAEAQKAYQRIRDEFPTSLQAQNIDKELARLGVIN